MKASSRLSVFGTSRGFNNPASYPDLVVATASESVSPLPTAALMSGWITSSWVNPPAATRDPSLRAELLRVLLRVPSGALATMWSSSVRAFSEYARMSCAPLIPTTLLKTMSRDSLTGLYASSLRSHSGISLLTVCHQVFWCDQPCINFTVRVNRWWCDNVSTARTDINTWHQVCTVFAVVT